MRGKGSFKESQVKKSSRLELGGLKQEVVRKAKGYGLCPSHRMNMVAVVTRLLRPAQDVLEDSSPPSPSPGLGAEPALFLSAG